MILWNTSCSQLLRAVRPRSSLKRYHITTSSILFLSPSLVPDPGGSAAGVRTVALMEHFANHFSQVHYGTGVLAAHNKHHKAVHDDLSRVAPSCTFHHLPPNRSKEMEHLLHQLPHLKAVVFDRYFAEEAYSFHLQKHRPDVVRIVDMQDMHSLRIGRQNLVKDWDRNKLALHETITTSPLDPSLLSKVMNYQPSLQYNGLIIKDESKISLKTQKDRGKKHNPHEIFMRELTALHRSDLILVCSPTELNLLRDVYRLPSHKLCLAPFFVPPEDPIPFDTKESSFHARQDFCTIGGFRHAPNIDSVKILKRHVWPQIRKKFPNANLYIYGAYPPQHILELHAPRDGFHIVGKVDTLDVLGKHRVLLAPLRFGAGLKGKIVDAWMYGLPVVTTPIGSEGMLSESDVLSGTYSSQCQGDILDTGWGGLIGTCLDSFVQASVQLYTDESLWVESARNGRYLLDTMYNDSKNLDGVMHAVQSTMDDLEQRRQRDYMGAMLWHQTARSTEYFSRWIELKETINLQKREQERNRDE